MKFDMTLTIGHNIEEEPKLNTEQILDAMQQILKPEGFTAYDAWGKWNDQEETSTVIKICGLDENTVKEYEERNIPLLASKLGQLTILCETISSNSKLIWQASPAEFAKYAKAI